MLTTIQPTSLLDDRVHNCIEELVAKCGARGGHTKTLVRPFVQNLQLLETYNTSWHERSRLFSVLDPENQCIWPVFDAKCMHRIRYGCDIDIYGEEAIRWLRVFTMMTTHEGDPFAIVGSVRDVEWLAGRSMDVDREPLLAELEVPTCVTSDDGGDTIVTATVLHQGTLYRCGFSVGTEPIRHAERPKLTLPGGWVKMVSDERIGDVQVVSSLKVLKPHTTDSNRIV